MQIELTWNLFLSALVFPVLILMIKKLSADAEKRSLKMHEKLDAVGEAIHTIQLDMGTKLEREQHEENCQTRTEDIWTRINNHCHDQHGNVVIPRGAAR